MMITQSELDDDHTFKERLFLIRTSLRHVFLENIAGYEDRFVDLGSEEADNQQEVGYQARYQIVKGVFTGQEIKDLRKIYAFSSNGYGSNLSLDVLPVFQMRRLTPDKIREVVVDCFERYREVKFHTSNPPDNYDDRDNNEIHDLGIFTLDKISDEEMLFYKLKGGVHYLARDHYYHGFTYFPELRK